jgi:hypothetical protein
VRGTNVDGTRLGKRDRLCAVSLVKRFAWPAVLADTLNQNAEAQHFPDIDTICAAEWLEALDGDERFRDLNWDGRHKRQPWSGHWLRWQSIEEAEEEGEIKPDLAAFDKIRRARSREFASPLPTYCAVVQLDDLPIPAMWPAELRRLLGRAESLPKGFAERVLESWRAYEAWRAKRPAREDADSRPTWPLSFVRLMQAASFLARGGKE